jgi:AcrR family transcriptional regulator
MVQNKRPHPGRPRLFDENEALDKAINLFWTKGFDAISVDDLAKAMGIGRPSMNGAFGDKNAVFMRALERYTETVCLKALEAMDSAKTAEQGVFAYLRETAEYSTSHPRHKGCMLGAVASAVDSVEVRQFVAKRLAITEERIAKRLRVAIVTGELPPNFPVEQRSRRAVNTMLAVSGRARQGEPLSELLDDVADGTALVFAAIKQS